MVSLRKLDVHGATTRHDEPIEVPEFVWDEIRRQYLAAMYLQRLWRTRLRMTFGDSPPIAERFTRELALPSPDDLHGEHGLRALTDESIFNDWSSYEQVVDMICEQPCLTDVPDAEYSALNDLSPTPLNSELGTRNS